MIFQRFGKCLAGNTYFSALITELLQKVQILTNERRDQKYSPNIKFTFIPIYFFLTVNLDIKTLTTVIETFLS